MRVQEDDEQALFVGESLKKLPVATHRSCRTALETEKKRSLTEPMSNAGNRLSFLRALEPQGGGEQAVRAADLQKSVQQFTSRVVDQEAVYEESVYIQRRAQDEDTEIIDELGYQYVTGDAAPTMARWTIRSASPVATSVVRT